MPHEPNRPIRAVALFGSYERDHYNDTALSLFTLDLQERLPGLEVERFVLPELFREMPTGEDLDLPGPVIERIGDRILECDLLLIGSPLYNFTLSPYLHTLFHRLRSRFMTIDDRDQVVARHMRGKHAVVLLTGRASRLKWMAVMRLLVMGQFSLTFRYWGGRVLGYHFLHGCHPGRLEERRPWLERRVRRFAERLAAKIVRMRKKV